MKSHCTTMPSAINYGRVAIKPKFHEVPLSAAEIFDATLQERIDYFNLKISLKDRYNRALDEEFHDVYLGTEQVMIKLDTSTEDIRRQLHVALTSEKSSVQAALKTHRPLQLALSNHFGPEAIKWLDDKKYDLTKELDILMAKLCDKNQKLMQVVHEVQQMEKYPRPGTEPWEIAMIKKENKIFRKMAKVQNKLEVANLLNTKYSKICDILKAEKDKYDPILKNMARTLAEYTREFEDISAIKRESEAFLTKARMDLRDTEKEALRSRIKMRQHLNRVLEKASEVDNRRKSKSRMFLGEPPVSQTPSKSTIVEQYVKLQLRKKIQEEILCLHAEIDEYEFRASNLVEVMRVSDLTFIPERMIFVREMTCKLFEEIDWKTEYRNLILAHLNSITNVEDYLKYTGYEEEERNSDNQLEMVDRLNELEITKSTILQDLEVCELKKMKYKLFILVLEMLLEEDKDRPTKEKQKTIEKVQLNVSRIYEKIQNLQYDIDDLEEIFENYGRPKRDYSYLAIPKFQETRQIKVEDGIPDEYIVEESVIEASTVPTNKSIKEKNLKFARRAKLRRLMKK